MKIDIFSHISTPKYKDSLSKLTSANPMGQQRAYNSAIRLSDIDARLKMMDQFEDYVQILTLGEPPIEQVAGQGETGELAKVANDSLAELVTKYPDKFVAAVGVLPLNNIDAAVKEIDRAINDLKLKGVLVYTNVNNKPLDSSEFLPIYEKMAYYDLPIWIHPTKDWDCADYKTEDRSYHRTIGLYDWPHETTIAMHRLACSGLLEKFPNLKFITHHCGGTLPYLAGRIVEMGARKFLTDPAPFQTLTKEPIEYLKMFYGDTANYGKVSALMCGYDFFGSEHMLFGTDMPEGSYSEPGVVGLKLAVKGIDCMPISDLDKKKIYEGNAQRILRLK